mgnify:CR=1 FL=1
MEKIEELENRIKALENHNINNIIKRVKRLEDTMQKLDKIMFSIVFNDKGETKWMPYYLYQWYFYYQLF